MGLSLGYYLRRCTSGFTSLRAGPKMSDLGICAVYLGGSGLRCAGVGFGLGFRVLGFRV